MKILKLLFIIIFLTETMYALGSTPIHELDKENFCRCEGTYARYSFEVLNGTLSGVELINGTNDAICDKYLMTRLISSTATDHPTGVKGVGVTGYFFRNKNLSYEECLSTEEIEIENYWYVEDVSIDLESINQSIE